MIQISEYAGELLRELAKAADEMDMVKVRIMADLLAELGYIHNSPVAKFEWSGVSQRG